MGKQFEHSIGARLENRVEERARHNFNEWLNKGNILSYDQLRNLNSTWK